MLQKIAEIMEYNELLVKANTTTDKGLQCAYILACSIITYANTIGSARKPFNPLLGETYEIYDPVTKAFFVLE